VRGQGRPQGRCRGGLPGYWVSAPCHAAAARCLPLLLVRAIMVMMPTMIIVVILAVMTVVMMVLVVMMKGELAALRVQSAHLHQHSCSLPRMPARMMMRKRAQKAHLCALGHTHSCVAPLRTQECVR